MIILKLGGSVITRKDKPTPTLHRDNLERISREIKESGVEELLIVHGAGSYGHPHAREYRIGSEIESNQELEQARLGFGVTQQSVQELNLEVCRAMTHSGIPSVSISPSSFITTHKKRINRIEIGLIRKYMDLGFVPILYGDVVLEEDLKIKMAVLSGDQILKYMAIHLGARRVILGTDVDGIYNRNPKTHPQAQLIPLVRSEDDLDFPGESNHMDVTGGMGGKLAELIELADRGIESEIINANQEGLLEKALRGERVTGTIITKKNI